MTMMTMTMMDKCSVDVQPVVERGSREEKKKQFSKRI